MSQTRKCKYCKQEIDKNVTVCPHCQKKQGVGCLTSAIVSIMVFLFVFFGIGIGVSSCAGKMTSENSESSVDTSIKKSVVTTTAEVITTKSEITTIAETASAEPITEPPTEPPAPAPTEPPTEVSTSAPLEETQETTLSPDMIKSVLELTISQNFSDYKIDYQEELNEYVISLWRDGITEGATLAVSSGDRTSWDNMVTSLKEMCNSFMDTINTLDPDANITVEVLNNLNTENRLLIIFDGIVMYDYVDEQLK